MIQSDDALRPADLEPDVALATGKVPYATGTVLTVDGGLTLPRL